RRANSAADAGRAPAERLTSPGPDRRIHTTRLRAVHGMLPRELAAKWIWWTLPEPPPRRTGLIDVLERDEDIVDWDPPEKTRAILAKMNDRHRERVRAAQDAGRPMAGTVYQRTRRDRDGLKVQRCEVRFDGVAGCLRTPAGGSSLQIVLKTDRKDVRTRRMTSRESARLMGLPDGYILPEGYYEAYHLTGDGVAVPVVTFLAEHILEPLASGTSEQRAADGPPETRRPRPRQAQLDLHGA
ncbi:MAG: DNA cytosine methyltransferase, partial [Acidobacteria bacterium]|nr:DNA cytosine methyltransferase [Acidobacteriota bacterium]